MSNQPLKPGQSAPRPGQYGIYGLRRGDIDREVTVTRGEPMPLTQKLGQTYRLDDATKHQSK